MSAAATGSAVIFLVEKTELVVVQLNRYFDTLFRKQLLYD